MSSTNTSLSEADARRIAGIAYLAVRAMEYAITGTKRGAERKEKCIDWIYNLLPDALQAIIPRDTLADFVEQAWSQMVNSLEAAAQ